MSSHKQGQIPLELGRPPVTETALGFYFRKIEGWNVLHHGLLWARFRSTYPELEFLPRIVEAPGPQPIEFDMTSPILRTGFTDKTKTQLVQIQDGLFLHNWRKREPLPEYMRYDKMSPALRHDWETFRRFLREENLNAPSVLRCEMTYFNHLVRGVDWKDFADLADIFTIWRQPPAPASFGTVQNAMFNIQYQLPSGAVNVGALPAIRSEDGKEIIQFALTSQTVPKSSDDSELFRSLDECHDNAQRAFVDFTTDKAREMWK